MLEKALLDVLEDRIFQFDSKAAKDVREATFSLIASLDKECKYIWLA